MTDRPRPRPERMAEDQSQPRSCRAAISPGAAKCAEVLAQQGVESSTTYWHSAVGT